MTIFEFLKEYKFTIPKRTGNKSYEELLIDELNLYFSILENVDDFEIHQNDSRKIQVDSIFKKSKYLSKGIIKVISLYLGGYPNKAFDSFSELLKSSEFNFKVLTIIGDVDFYRARYPSENEYFSKNNLFHIPFESRRFISTQRYSIPGFPSLYLSNSAYTCWEELKRPNIENLYFSRFISKKNINLFQIPFPKAEIEKYVIKDKVVEGVIGTGIDSLLVNWPLYLACSVRVKNPEVPFKIEYVIPQLLLQYVRLNSGLDGIEYFSTNIDYESKNIEGLFTNYVFPVKKISSNGYCKILVDSFSLTEPISHNLIKASTSGVLTTYFNEESESDHIDKIEVIKGRATPYFVSIFGAIERNLRSLKDSHI